MIGFKKRPDIVKAKMKRGAKKAAAALLSLATVLSSVPVNAAMEDAGAAPGGLSELRTEISSEMSLTLTAAEEMLFPEESSVSVEVLEGKFPDPEIAAEMKSALAASVSSLWGKDKGFDSLDCSGTVLNLTYFSYALSDMDGDSLDWMEPDGEIVVENASHAGLLVEGKEEACLYSFLDGQPEKIEVMVTFSTETMEDGLEKPARIIIGARGFAPGNYAVVLYDTAWQPEETAGSEADSPQESSTIPGDGTDEDTAGGQGNEGDNEEVRIGAGGQDAGEVRIGEKPAEGEVRIGENLNEGEPRTGEDTNNGEVRIGGDLNEGEVRIGDESPDGQEASAPDEGLDKDGDESQAGQYENGNDVRLPDPGDPEGTGSENDSPLEKEYGEENRLTEETTSGEETGEGNTSGLSESMEQMTEAGTEAGTDGWMNREEGLIESTEAGQENETEAVTETIWEPETEAVTVTENILGPETEAVTEIEHTLEPETEAGTENADGQETRLPAIDGGADGEGVPILGDRPAWMRKGAWKYPRTHPWKRNPWQRTQPKLF